MTKKKQLTMKTKERYIPRPFPSEAQAQEAADTLKNLAAKAAKARAAGGPFPPPSTIPPEEMIQGLQDQIQRLYGELRDAKRQPEVRVLRLVEYAGTRDAVEETIRRSIHGTREGFRGQCMITAVTLHEYPEILKVARAAKTENVVTADREGVRGVGGQGFGSY